MSAAMLVVVVVLLGWVGLFPRDSYFRVRCRSTLVRHGRVSALRRPDREPRVLPRSGASTCDEVAVVADRLAVALAAGVPVRRGVMEAAAPLERQRPDSPLVTTGRELQRGVALDEALGTLAGSDPRWHHLATQLAISAQAGTPAAGTMRRLARQERLRARRMRELRARRLPVLLLLPLVTMVLPAFVLVTVVPFVIAGGISLELPPPAGVPDGAPPRTPEPLVLQESKEWSDVSNPDGDEGP